MATLLSSTPSSLFLRYPNHNLKPYRSLSSKPFSPQPLRLFHRSSSPFTAFASVLTPPPPPPPSPLLSNSTRTLTSLLSLLLSISRSLLSLIPSPPDVSATGPLLSTTGSLFFARIRNRSSSSSAYLNTPLTVVASGMAKWLDLYSGVLMVRVLLSWFPNIPWDRQPLSAIRDLCDPYLSLFRNIIPPVFDTLDVSPLLAFSVLGILSSILTSTRAMR